ncbi:histone H1-like repetitive region-containing protein [Streptomyces sp. DT193]|uniref:histone H1-like repetitive region-containing protein n=1 Tax=Streptomyces sp. DT193 TaxID=3393418 RepID=UPI003CED6195
MNVTTKIALAAAVAGGYLLGRLKKGRLTFAVATYLAGRRFGLDPQQLATEGLKRLSEVPAVAELQDQLRGELMNAGHEALAAPAPAEKTPAEKTPAMKAAAKKASPPAKKAAAKKTGAKKTGAKKTAAKKAAAKKTAAKKTVAERAPAKETTAKKAPAKKVPGKKAPAKRPSSRAAKGASGRRR